MPWPPDDTLEKWEREQRRQAAREMERERELRRIEGRIENRRAFSVVVLALCASAVFVAACVALGVWQ